MPEIDLSELKKRIRRAMGLTLAELEEKIQQKRGDLKGLISEEQALKILEKELSMKTQEGGSLKSNEAINVINIESKDPSDKKQVNKLLEQMALLDENLKRITDLNKRLNSDNASFYEEAETITQEIEKQLKLNPLNRDVLHQLFTDLMKVLKSHHGQMQNTTKSMTTTLVQAKSHVFRSKPTLILYMQNKTAEYQRTKAERSNFRNANDLMQDGENL